MKSIIMLQNYDQNLIPEIQRSAVAEFMARVSALYNENSLVVLPVRNGVKKDCLFMAATHGDERIGIEVLSSLASAPEFDWQINNERACEQGKRFLQYDLNRSAPGDLNSADYETRRAAEILRTAKNYNYVIDVHGTVAKSGLFVILTKLSLEDFLLALTLNIENIVIWLPSTERATGPLVQFLTPALEIECGPKDEPAVAEKLRAIVLDFLTKFREPIPVSVLAKKKIYFVYGKMEKSEKSLIDFKMIDNGQEVFYPILSGEYGLAAYKMIKLWG